MYIYIYIGLSPLPVRVTTRIITFLVGNPYKPSFPLLLGGGTTQDITPLFDFICVYVLGIHPFIPYMNQIHVQSTEASHRWDASNGTRPIRPKRHRTPGNGFDWTVFWVQRYGLKRIHPQKLTCFMKDSGWKASLSF